MNYYEFTKKKYPEMFKKGYVFRTNIDRDSSKGKRRETKKWCASFLSEVHFDNKTFTIEFGVIRDNLPAYSPYGPGEFDHLVPAFGKMKLFPGV